MHLKIYILEKIGKSRYQIAHVICAQSPTSLYVHICGQEPFIWDEWNKVEYLGVGGLATQAEAEATQCSWQQGRPLFPATPCALPCHGGPVPALPNIWSGRVQSTESRGTGDHLGNTKTNRIRPPSKIKCPGGLRLLMSTVTVSKLQPMSKKPEQRKCLHCAPLHRVYKWYTVCANSVNIVPHWHLTLQQYKNSQSQSHIIFIIIIFIQMYFHEMVSILFYWNTFSQYAFNICCSSQMLGSCRTACTRRYWSPRCNKRVKTG